MYENNGSIKKLTMQAYSDPKLKEAKGDPFVTLLNPEKYSINYKSEFKDQVPQGNAKSSPVFLRSVPQDLDIEFLLDRTGLIAEVPGTEPGKKDIGVEDDVKKFREIAFEFVGDIHKPNYLRISWGTLDFPCQLTDMTVEYKLFASDGKPIRAIIKAKFKYFIDEDKAVKEQGKKSPDLTHYRIIKAGDTLPLMTFRIYGDSKYYLEVARVNKLSSFRKLIPGKQLFFPPLEKQG